MLKIKKTWKKYFFTSLTILPLGLSSFSLACWQKPKTQEQIEPEIENVLNTINDLETKLFDKKPSEVAKINQTIRDLEILGVSSKILDTSFNVSYIVKTIDDQKGSITLETTITKNNHSRLKKITIRGFKSFDSKTISQILEKVANSYSKNNSIEKIQVKMNKTYTIQELDIDINLELEIENETVKFLFEIKGKTEKEGIITKFL